MKYDSIAGIHNLTGQPVRVYSLDGMLIDTLPPEVYYPPSLVSTREAVDVPGFPWPLLRVTVTIDPGDPPIDDFPQGSFLLLPQELSAASRLLREEFPGYVFLVGNIDTAEWDYDKLVGYRHFCII